MTYPKKYIDLQTLHICLRWHCIGSQQMGLPSPNQFQLKINSNFTLLTLLMIFQVSSSSQQCLIFLFDVYVHFQPFSSPFFYKEMFSFKQKDSPCLTNFSYWLGNLREFGKLSPTQIFFIFFTQPFFVTKTMKRLF